jgi:uncharacterized protein (TIGR02145 family)
MIMRIRFSAIVFFCALCSVVSAQDFVDLGLSVKWSTLNTGITADRPVGWYYRWPDAMELKTADGSRMASKAEWDELRRYCTWKWAEQDGIAGYLVTSKIKGYTDRSIFLPAAGWLQDGKLMQVGTYASYWCSTPGVQPDNEAAYGFNFKRGADEWHSENRESEQSVRMVMPLSGKEVSSISLETTKLTLQQGTGTRLNVTMGKRDVNSACTWKSSDENVIKVIEDGLLVAAGPGSCKVVATAYGKTAECIITVTPHESEYVDLGLSVLWATANLGASAPESYGDYYAWAEIEPKEFFSWGTYRYSSFTNEEGMDKYTIDGLSHQYLKADNLNRLEPTDDAATVMLGDNWRMPTTDEFAELVSNCTFDIATVNGVAGIRFTSQVPGFEQRSIFIPYSGYMNGNEPIEKGKQLSLWTSIAGRGTRGSCFSTSASVNGIMMMDEMSPIEVLEMALRYQSNSLESRFIGMNIRPVRALNDDMFTSLSLSEEHLDLNYGEIRNINAVMMPSGRPIKPTSISWSSSAPDIVSTNDDGSVTAVGQGECIITAESDGRKTQMTVKVTLPVPDAVDLGLSVKWASANLGASKPDEAGGYFAWGETAPKAGVYDGKKYKFGEYSNQMTKYNFYTVLSSTLRSLTTVTPVDCKVTLDPEDDAATVLLGGGWRMPTADELWELKTKCTWTPVTTVLDSTEFFVEQRLEGCLITSNVPGYEGNSIFLPAAGFISDHDNYSSEGGVVSNKGSDLCYWTSTLEQSIGNTRRWYGNTIRPVLDDNPSGNKPVIAPDPVKAPKRNVMVDLGLSVLWADCNVGAESPEEAGARFAWGETVPKTYYSDYNYKYKKNYDDMYWWYFKYSVGDQYDEAPFIDGKKRLESVDDAARANWGGKWRTPTKEEYAELFKKCEWTETTVNGVGGFLITSKVPGYTSNSIFLPYHCPDDVIEDSWRDNQSDYLTSDLGSSGSNLCIVLYISENKVGTLDEVDLGLERMAKIHITSKNRSSGYQLRAVCEK